MCKIQYNNSVLNSNYSGYTYLYPLVHIWKYLYLADSVHILHLFFVPCRRNSEARLLLTGK